MPSHSLRPSPLAIAASQFVAVLLLVVACSPGWASSAAERLIPDPLPAASDWTYLIDGEQALWLLYYADGKVPSLRDPAGDTRSLIPPGAAPAPSGAGLIPLAESSVLALWRSKQPKKSLYLSRSDRPVAETLDLGGASEPSKRFVAARIGDRLAALWVGEGDVEGSSSTYNIFYRELGLTADSLDAGALSATEHLFPGFYPVWNVGADDSITAFSWIKDGDLARVVARTRAPGADRFDEPVAVADVPLITPVFRSFRSGDRVFGVWLAQHSDDFSEMQLEGAYSDDAGKQWTTFSFPDLRGYDVASLDVAANDDGKIALVLAARQREPDPNAKRDVKLLFSADRGGSWSQPSSIRSPEVQGRFHGQNPTVAFGTKPGELLVVWEDWRNIRARLYASYSEDWGQTWIASNVQLPYGAGKNLRLNPRRSSLFRQGDRFRLIAEEAVDDRLKEKVLVALDIDPENQLTVAGPTGATGAAPQGSAPVSAAKADAAPAPREDDAMHEPALRDRITGFWNAMIEEDYAAAYSFYDPFYRARIDSASFVATMGRVRYSQFEIEDLTLDGAVASSKTQVTYKIGPFKVETTGEVVDKPEQQVTVDATWLKIDGTWYREFHNQFDDLTYTEY